MTLTLELYLDILSLDLPAEIQACMFVHLARIVIRTHTHTDRETRDVMKGYDGVKIVDHRKLQNGAGSSFKL